MIDGTLYNELVEYFGLNKEIVIDFQDKPNVNWRTIMSNDRTKIRYETVGDVVYIRHIIYF